MIAIGRHILQVGNVCGKVPWCPKDTTHGRSPTPLPYRFPRLHVHGWREPRQLTRACALWCPITHWVMRNSNNTECNDMLCWCLYPDFFSFTIRNCKKYKIKTLLILNVYWDKCTKVCWNKREDVHGNQRLIISNNADPQKRKKNNESKLFYLSNLNLWYLNDCALFGHVQVDRQYKCLCFIPLFKFFSMKKIF